MTHLLFCNLWQCSVFICFLEPVVLILDVYAQFGLGIVQVCIDYSDYISPIHDIPVILLHYYQLLGQLMQQRNTVALPARCVYVSISQSARRVIYRGD